LALRIIHAGDWKNLVPPVTVELPAPLHMACQEGLREIVQALLSKISPPRNSFRFKARISCVTPFPCLQSVLNSKNIEGNTSLKTACERGYETIALSLLKSYEYDKSDYSSWNKAFLSAERNNMDKALVSMLERGLYSSFDTTRQKELLLRACSKGLINLVNYLEGKGVPIDACNRQNETLMHLAQQFPLGIFERRFKI
jgi:ankyrin repeat protein